jgi:manganese transport protein
VTGGPRDLLTDRRVGRYGLFSAVALPLTYLPTLVVAKDPEHMGKHVDGRVVNALGTVYLVMVVAAAVVAIPLVIATGAGS